MIFKHIQNQATADKVFVGHTITAKHRNDNREALILQVQFFHGDREISKRWRELRDSMPGTVALLENSPPLLLVVCGMRLSGDHVVVRQIMTAAGECIDGMENVGRFFYPESSDAMPSFSFVHSLWLPTPADKRDLYKKKISWSDIKENIIQLANQYHREYRNKYQFQEFLERVRYSFKDKNQLALWLQNKQRRII